LNGFMPLLSNTFGSMHHLSNKRKNRFAWLTPLSTQGATKGPWIITDNQTCRFFETDNARCRKISAASLLALAAGVLDTASSGSDNEMRDTWTSDCGKYRVDWIKQASNSVRLFVQQKEDYYARIELYIDNALMAAFHEPVWPHLQQSTPASTDRLVVPGDYLDALEANAIHIKQKPELSDIWSDGADDNMAQAA